MISLVAAVDKKRVIGKDNDLVWKGIPGDMKLFKELTTGHPIIMGRKTFESIGSKALPNRTNIIVTRNHSFSAPDSIVVYSLEDGLRIAQEKDRDVFIIGGGEIYSQAMNVADRLYLTLVDAETSGDIFFPDYNAFTKVVSSEKFSSSEKFPHAYTFLTLEK